MAVGGIWETQDKIRPGAYINIAYERSPQQAVNARGVVAIALPMTWGAENALTTVTSKDLSNVKEAISKLGCTALEQESLPFRLALSKASTAFVYRADTGGSKAIAMELDTSGGSVSILSAKYAGTSGNKLTVNVEKPMEGSSRSNVSISYISGSSVFSLESFYVANFPLGLANVKSKYVEFADATELADLPSSYEGALYSLSGGTNGVLTADANEFTELLMFKQWDTVVTLVPEMEDTIYNFVHRLRYEEGRATQFVFHSATATEKLCNSIVTSQGFKGASETVSAELFPVYVASLTAGADINESNTGLEVAGAVEIINPYSHDEIRSRLAKNEFLISYRQDGVIVIERDVNVGEFSEKTVNIKNRVLRCLNDINNNVSLMFNRDFLGKIDNQPDGRNLFKSAIISYMDSLQNRSAIQNFDSTTDISVEMGNDIESVLVNVAVQPVDSVEKLYMTVTVKA